MDLVNKQWLDGELNFYFRYKRKIIENEIVGTCLNVGCGEHKIKGTYPISYADAFAVATAIERSGILVTGDPELKRLEKDKKVEILWIQNG